MCDKCAFAYVPPGCWIVILQPGNILVGSQQAASTKDISYEDI